MKPLMVAVPSKGRLEENTAGIFAKAGMALKRADARDYRGRVSGFGDIEVLYLSAGEIAARLVEGSIHFGITGEDLLREEVTDMDSVIQLVLPLGFGRADVVVAIPDGWIDVTRMADFAEIATEFRARHAKRLRVATKYTQLAADFFARHGVSDYVLVQSFGATEGAPSSGVAEAIVDITSTGATLAANKLRVPEDGVILKSEANLAASLTADWSDAARGDAKSLLMRLAAFTHAADYVKIDIMHHPDQRTGEPVATFMDTLIDTLINDAQTRFGAIFDYTHRRSYGLAVGLNNILVPQKNMQAFIEAVTAAGFERAIVTRPDFIFENRNTLYDRLAGAIL